MTAVTTLFTNTMTAVNQLVDFGLPFVDPTNVNATIFTYLVDISIGIPFGMLVLRSIMGLFRRGRRRR